jgi:hypothetical protein
VASSTGYTTIRIAPRSILPFLSQPPIIPGPPSTISAIPRHLLRCPKPASASQSKKGQSISLANPPSIASVSCLGSFFLYASLRAAFLRPLQRTAFRTRLSREWPGAVSFIHTQPASAPSKFLACHIPTSSASKPPFPLPLHLLLRLLSSASAIAPIPYILP